MSYEDLVIELDNWGKTHFDAAIKEGWSLCDSDGSEDGTPQVQFIVDEGILKSDPEAWWLVSNGSGEHHKAALEVIKKHNPKEHTRVMSMHGKDRP